MLLKTCPFSIFPVPKLNTYCSIDFEKIIYQTFSPTIVKCGNAILTNDEEKNKRKLRFSHNHMNPEAGTRRYTPLKPCDLYCPAGIMNCNLFWLCITIVR